MPARSVRKLICLILVLPLLANSSAQDLHAQKAREVVGGLLRGLLESEVERRDQRQEEPFRRDDRQTRPAVSNRKVSPKSNQARGYFQTFANESKQLARLLEQQARTVPGARSHLDETLKLRARTEFLNQRYAQPQPDLVLAQDIRQLDRDWRLTSYHLASLSGLSNQCRDTIKRLDEINGRCTQLFDIAPQVNRREIVRLADALAAEIHHLERDVEFELRSSPKARPLVNQLRRIEARAKLLGDSAADGDSYEIIVKEFKRFSSEWANLSRQLEKFNDRHIDRTIEEIHEINRGLHEQLLLPVRIDRSHLTHLTNQADRRIQSLTDEFTLSILAELSDARGIVKATRSLCEEVEHLRVAISQNGPEEELLAHWQVLDSAWREFVLYSQPVKSGRIHGLCQEITAILDAMRRDLGVQLSFDRREVVRIAADLAGIVEQAHFHTQQWQRRAGLRVDKSILRDLKQLIQDCNHLHEECAGRATQEHLARDCRGVGQKWASLRPQLLACDTIDRNALRRISDQATSRLVRLQVILEP